MASEASPRRWEQAEWNKVGASGQALFCGNGGDGHSPSAAPGVSAGYAGAGSGILGAGQTRRAFLPPAWPF